MSERVVIVTGSREWPRANRWPIATHLEALRPGLLVHGGARGVDTLAEEWACAFGVPVERCDADWWRYGKSAGMVRNQRMLEEWPQALVLAFPLGESRGTRGCMRLAAERGMPLKVIGPEGEVLSFVGEWPK